MTKENPSLTSPQPPLVSAPLVSVVVPIKNEAENIVPLITEIIAALTPVADFEILYIDDGSTDQSVAILQQTCATVPQLRILQHSQSCGQSAAVRTGVYAARGTIIATLDGDGQNDPADIPAMLARMQQADSPALVAGQRLKRQDSFSKKLSSKIANSVRASLLKDDTADTGCGLKLFRRDVFLALPFFDHLHRYLPALVKREGLTIALMPVGHRPRVAGVTKYGVMNRLWVGIADLVGVMWLLRRRRLAKIAEITPAAVASTLENAA